MNRAHWKAMLPYIAAFVNGEAVETLNGTVWVKLQDPSFEGRPENYRIAPRTIRIGSDIDKENPPDYPAEWQGEKGWVKVGKPQPTTVRGWLETLPDGYRERALGQMSRPNENVTALRYAVANLIGWQRTKEGFDFWNAVCEYDEGKRGLPPLPADTPESAIVTTLETTLDDDLTERIAPRTIRIGAFDVPEPYRGEMREGQGYFIPNICCISEFASGVRWHGGKFDHIYLKRGLVHLTPEAAELHGKALASLTAGEGVEL